MTTTMVYESEFCGTFKKPGKRKVTNFQAKKNMQRQLKKAWDKADPVDVNGMVFCIEPRNVLDFLPKPE